MSTYEKELIELTRKLKQHLPCCPNCFNFNSQTEMCEIARQRPPAHVIAFGCPQFDYCPF